MSEVMQAGLPIQPTIVTTQDSTSRPAFYTGILPCQEIERMLRSREIQFEQPLEPDQIQPASIDLRLGHYAYRVETSFLPGSGVKVTEKLKQLDARFENFKIDLRSGAVLEKNCVYVIPLLERISLKSDITALANPKSSTGRLDILTRLITDGATHFDQVGDSYKGQLYIEVVPRSFSIVVKTGTRLNQLRFRRMRGETAKPIRAEDWKQLIDEGQIVDISNYQDKNVLYKNTGLLPFTVDLRGTGQGALIGWRAKKHTQPLDLERRDYNAQDYWDILRFNKDPSLHLTPDEFYILMTKEAIAVPPEYAAEMLPYDTRAGEFRVHYAGFFDPGFGWDSKIGRVGRSRGVLEVRSHEVPFLLEDGQTVGWLSYERMAVKPQILYGQDINSNYQGQGLKLAKQFAPFKDEFA